MTKDFETLLYLFGDSSLGKKSRIKSVENPDAIIDMAVKQGIWSCIYPMLDEICDVKKYYFDFLALVSKSVARNEFTLNILDEAMKNGIMICMLKGMVVASLYANPDYRVSSDTDILIDKKDEKKMVEFLLSKGYDVEKREKNDHHMKAFHKIGGLLEVHIFLNSKIEANLGFGGYFKYDEEFETIQIGDRKVVTLGVNDNLYFLTSHYIRHFISGGSSIRQMMDLLLYMIKYNDRIDFVQYNEVLKHLNYHKLIQLVMMVGNKYFGLNFDVTEESGMMDLLEDCEFCGLFGSNSKYATNINYEFYKMKSGLPSYKLKFWFWFRAETTLFQRIFPNQNVLVKMGYTYVKHKWIVPVAWINRVIDCFLGKKKKSMKFKNNCVGEQRLALMKKLSIIH